LRWPSRDLVLLGAAGFGALWGTYGFVTWSNALMTKGSHVSARQAGVVVVIVGLAAVVSKPLVGLLTDRLGARRKGPTMAVLGMFAVTLVGFGACRSLTAFLWIAPVLGVVAYVYSPLMVAMIPELASTGRTGTAAGVTNACWQLGSAVVPVVVGGVFDATRSFFAAFATLAAGPLVGLMLMAAVREPAGMDQPERMEVGMT
jgi:MFS family permease